MSFEDHHLRIAAAVQAYNLAVAWAKDDGYKVSITLAGDNSSIWALDLIARVNTVEPKVSPPKE